MSLKNFRKFPFILSLAAVALTSSLFLREIHQTATTKNWLGPQITKQKLQETLGKQIISAAKLETETTLQIDGEQYRVQYSVDSELQNAAERAIKSARVPYAAAVAIDPSSGKVLALATHGMKNENLALRATFPAASVFKIVTAAAAIQSGKLRYDSLIPVLGSYHTLYKRNLFKGGGLEPTSAPRFARLISLRDAFGKSVNSVFGKIGLFGVGGNGLRKMAEAFEFGSDIPFELALDSSSVVIPDGGYELAESASGFTRQNLMSPLHGALIAATIANGGVMMQPSIVSRVTDEREVSVYESEPLKLSEPINEQTAEQLAVLMNRTVTAGTSRRSFRGFKRDRYLAGAFIGGKTGTLNGSNPPGRYDWFVGFANRDGTRIAICTLCIHGKYYGIKASHVARQILQKFYEDVITAQR